MADKRMKQGFAAVLATLLAGCASDTPEDRLRATITAMEQAVEAHSPGDFVDGVAADFSGEGGQLDRDTLRRVLASEMMGNDRISVVLGPPEIVMHGGERATVRVSALVTGGRLLPERADSLKIESGWRLEDGEWRCYTATWL